MKKLISSALFTIAALSAGAAQAIPSLSFIIDGDTFNNPYSITNNSTAGETVTRFSLNLGTIPSGGPFCFDTVNGGPCNPSPQSPTPFSPVGSTGVTTGLTSPAVVSDGAQILDLFFNDFNPGETFSWNIDIDSASAFTTLGSQLIGATAFVDFSNGQRLLGSLLAVAGNPDATQFTVTGVVPVGRVPEPSTMALMALAGLAFLRRRKV
ncbi:MAG TPA: PEP-CTERM sorting domain-containing protein [Noviherbaspirillum sp.]|uniref:PEP-CTERM sorting domain-containing protein n=1 Tax=Noviherbaspirillum sp. TaxID=1926288 RepID=UPI002DDCF6A2|nr:PEP-CTERM sorting domain-containing protein [Noviherbaspirillum sp.]HEV2612844.1 PEP-CTERM sorting domain-containing protein [Noviherbaspirillum sp.]